LSEHTGSLTQIGVSGDFPEGEGRVVTAARKPIAVFNVDGRLYAVNNICPHLGGPIGAGCIVEGTVVACPYHGMRFDLATGASADEFGHGLETYEIVVEDEKVFVKVWWAKNKR
jgi:nitrite reductase/ring-hydroxylating ferredoxin subunit